MAIRKNGLISYRAHVTQFLEEVIRVIDCIGYKCQLNSAAKIINTCDKSTCITLASKKHEELEKKFPKFPLIIAPPYASLIQEEKNRADPLLSRHCSKSNKRRLYSFLY